MTFSLAEIRKEMKRLATPQRAEASKWFFRTGPGEYGEGDVFLGLSVPQVRGLARTFKDAPAEARRGLLASPVHEERQLALFLMVRAYERGDEATRKAIYADYLANRARVNNWDLVDGSAPQIVGAHLLSQGMKGADKLLTGLARSKSLWDRRIAVLATQAFIRAGEFAMTLKLAEHLLGDKEDLIHKAVGWMLRETGQRDLAVEEGFLKRYAARMPRTMLRYAIEKLPPAKRKAYMGMKKVGLNKA
jgi:3-methyladenine DNA glycosylase AlkD